MATLDNVSRTASPAATWSRGARLAGALTFIIAGLLWLLADVLTSLQEGGGSPAWIAAHPGPAGVAISADMLATPFLIGATAVWLLLSVRRSPRLAWTGVVLLVFGLTGQAILAGVELASYTVGLSGKIDPVAFDQAMGDGPDASLPGTVFMVMFFGGAFIGIVVMMVAVWRSGALPRIAVILLLAFQLADLVEPPFPTTVLAAAGFACMAVALLRVRSAGGLASTDRRDDSPDMRAAERS